MTEFEIYSQAQDAYIDWEDEHPGTLSGINKNTRWSAIDVGITFTREDLVQMLEHMRKYGGW